MNHPKAPSFPSLRIRLPARAPQLPARSASRQPLVFSPPPGFFAFELATAQGTTFRAVGDADAFAPLLKGIGIGLGIVGGLALLDGLSGSGRKR